MWSKISTSLSTEKNNNSNNHNNKSIHLQEQIFLSWKDFGHVSTSRVMRRISHVCVHMYLAINVPCSRISSSEDYKKADHSLFFLNHPCQLIVWISASPDLQYFPFCWVETTQSCYWGQCFSSLCSGLLDSVWTFSRSSPSSVGWSWFLWKCMSACTADIPKHSIFMLWLLCWDLKCSELFLLDKHEH